MPFESECLIENRLVMTEAGGRGGSQRIATVPKMKLPQEKAGSQAWAPRATSGDTERALPMPISELWFIVHFNCGKDLTECKVKAFSQACGGMG